MTEKIRSNFRFFQQFAVGRILGSGTFGVVFEATNNIDNRSYAVKRIVVDPKRVLRILN